MTIMILSRQALDFLEPILPAADAIGCACRKSNPGILVMQPAQNWATKNVPG
jgi:hypothetical protein